MKIDVRSKESVYITINEVTYYIDDSTNEQIVEVDNGVNLINYVPDTYAEGGVMRKRGVKGDLSKLDYFKDAYRGAEFYSLQDNNDFYKEYITKSDRWYVLMLKNQKGNGLTAKEYKEFKSLSLDLLMASDTYAEGGEKQSTTKN